MLRTEHPLRLRDNPTEAFLFFTSLTLHPELSPPAVLTAQPYIRLTPLPPNQGAGAWSQTYLSCNPGPAAYELRGLGQFRTLSGFSFSSIK